MPIMRVIAHYTNDRLFEWAMALALITVGLQVAVWPVLLGEWSRAWPVMVLVGMGRSLALIANGRSYVYGPRIRAFGALIGALVWSQILVALLVVAPRHDAPSLEVPVLFIMTLCELYSSYRAATDVRTPRQAA